MKLPILLCMLVLLCFATVSGQQPSEENGNRVGHSDLAITGCLTKNVHKEYELVDKDGIDNLPYSANIDLDKYVGQAVTLVGRRAASPSAETNAGPVKTHFLVTKVESASGQCRQ
jgi:hypothetical protein